MTIICSRIKLLSILLFLFLSTGIAQEFKFETITTTDGLSQNLITRIFQDSRHFLWIGTASGLNRYDGSKFKIYKSIHTDPKTLSGHNFSDIVEDKEGNLWIASSGGGLNKYIRKKDSFVRIQSDRKNPNTPLSDRINALLLDKNNHLWIGTESGLSRVDLKTGKYRHFKANPNNPDSLCSFQISALCEDSDGKIWVGTWLGLSVYDPQKNNFKSYSRNPGNPRSLSQNYVHVIYEDKRKNIWIGTHNGLNLYDKKSNDFTRFLPDPKNPKSINNEIVRDILEDRRGNLWIATSFRGLNLYDRDNKIFKHFMHSPFSPRSISSNNLLCLYEDDSGLLWVGTFGGGLNKLDFRKSQFQQISNEPESQNSLNNNHIASITVDKDNSIWIGTLGGGLNHLIRNGDKKIFECYNHNLSDPNGLISDQVYSIAVDDENNLWLGTESGLQKFTKSTNTFTLYNPFSNLDFLNTSIFSVMIDHAGTLWVATYRSGISYFNKKTGRFINISHNPNNPKSISSDAVRYVYEDSKKHIWVCTESGLDYFDQTKNEFIHFKSDPNDPYSLIDNTILLAFEDSMGNLWIGTPFGLNKLVGNIDEPKTVKFERFTTSEGLPGNNIQGILEDTSKHLWISTNNGLSKFNSLTKTFENFSIDDGLQSNGFYVTACAKITKTGEMLFGGDEGFNIFKPENISHDLYSPPVVITDFLIDNNPVPIDKEFNGGKIILNEVISETKEIVLPYNKNNISFEFSSLSFSSPSSNRHAYKLEGLNDTWNDIGNRRFASFTNLSPGEYIFKVKAANHSGIWSKNSASLRIIITPPFWQTFWFRAFGLIAISGLIIFAYRYKTRNIQRRSKELQEEVDNRTAELKKINYQLQAEVSERIKIEEKLVASKETAESANRSKSEFIANMSHELRTPLNAILGYTQILRKQNNITPTQKDHLLTIMKSGEHLLTLINDILDLRRIEVRREEVNNSEFNLHILIRDVVNTIRVKAIEKQLPFTYEKEPAVPERVIGDAKKIKQVLLNLLGNSVKYTSQGSIGLDVECKMINPGNNADKSKSKMIFKITDTGMGIPKEKFEEIFQPFASREKTISKIESTGLGLAITKRLVELMGGVLTLKSEVDKGTTFIFELDLDVIEGIEKKNIVLEKNIIGFEGSKKNILIVDDNKTNIEMLVTILKPLGFDIVTAEDGVHALENIRTSAPDLILLDLLMPDMNGQHFLEEVKRTEQNDKIKIIGISAAVADIKSIEKFASDCDAFIPKPIDASLLLNEIRNVLKIIWIEDEGYEVQSENDNEMSREKTPPDDTLNKIISFASIGDYKSLGQLLDKIENDADEFKIFCDNIRKMAKNFDDDAIVQYCGLSKIF